MSEYAIQAEGIRVTYRPFTAKVPLLGKILSKSGPEVHALDGVDYRACFGSRSRAFIQSKSKRFITHSRIR